VAGFERDDVQGILVSGFGQSMAAARYLLLAVNEPAAARRWLGDLAGRITTSERPEAERCTNIAFSSSGLEALGVTSGELATFSTPFREGMTSEHRRRLLGDLGPSDPQRWGWGGPGAGQGAPAPPPVHVVLLLFARDEEVMAEVEASELAALGAGDGLRLVLRLAPEPFPGAQRVGKLGVEHFGFADGMSQPVIRGSGQEDRLAGDDARRTVIEAGEFILGYPNGYGQLTPWPRLALPGGGGGDFGRNGTYLVVRQLAQDVAAFWRFLRDATRAADGGADPEEMERLGARLVGRWRSGAPLVRAHLRDDPDLGTDNSFGYAATDRFGQRCPIGAHIRRSNPRDSLADDPASALELANLHRIVRRGRVYGPPLEDPLAGDDGQERGLLFLCLNANIERQFEFVQHSWCNNPKFGGLYDEQDPLLGNQPGADRTFTVQDVPFRRKLRGLPTFVTVRGGGYFFLPGVRALHTLATLGR
jgi:Dyp-type peroxidase family